MKLETIIQNILIKEGRLKRYQDKIKQYKQNSTVENNKRKFYQQVEGECTKTNQRLDAKETEQLWSKTREQKEHNRKAYWRNNFKKFKDLKRVLR